MYLVLMKKIPNISTCIQLGSETLGSQPIFAQNLPIHRDSWVTYFKWGVLKSPLFLLVLGHEVQRAMS
jgi:hypothetical protein